ncbi:MAG: hypothetical protein JWN99_775 [Ilumatobacteraceae bacterium]|nr:hypothetical protein [Ilumatobacteraceae bacterium]
MTTIEDKVRVVLHSQAAAMRVPDSQPGQQMARIIDLPDPRRRTRLPMVAAAAVLVLASGLALAQRRDGPSGAVDPAAEGVLPLHLETPTVVLDAASVQVVANGGTFTPTSDLRVHGDPGILGQSTTLELTWHDGDIQQRVNLYFTSDGVDWWANEIRTYNGQADAQWVEPPAVGQFFKSPIGTPFVGNLDLPNLRIDGMTLLAFRRPALCDSATGALALLADFPQIDAGPGYYGATMQVLDPATCAAVPVAPYTFECTSDDPTIATFDTDQNNSPDYPVTKSWLQLRLLTPGETTVHAVARDAAGTIIGTADMHVTVRPGDPSATTDATDPGAPVPAAG